MYNTENIFRTCCTIRRKVGRTKQSQQKCRKGGQWQFMLKPIGQVLPNKFFRDLTLVHLCMCGLSFLLCFKRLNFSVGFKIYRTLRFANRPITRTIKNLDSHIKQMLRKLFYHCCYTVFIMFRLCRLIKYDLLCVHRLLLMTFYLFYNFSLTWVIIKYILYTSRNIFNAEYQVI